ncbi:MAG: nucleic acid-binding protein [Chloroflexi bacterium]|nr:nucleic acid-binding protein [Chloroflexota bacterium]
MYDVAKYNRSCIVCRVKTNKYTLIRFVRQNESILLDLNMDMQGRGAYVCKENKCYLQNVIKKKLCYALKISINDINWNKLLLEVNNVI